MKTKGGKWWMAARDPDKPKRPLSAYFVLMEEFREQYKKEHPNNKSVTVVGRACGEKWRSLSEQEKAPYVEKALKLKHDYEQKMLSYYKKLESSWEESGSEDSSSADVAFQEQESIWEESIWEDVGSDIQEKAPFVDKALQQKTDYDQKLESNKKKPESSCRPEQISPDNRNQSVPQATSSDRVRHFGAP